MSILSLLHAKKTIVLDGAMGTELQRRGYRTQLPLWSAGANIDAPLLVEQIHKDFIIARADIITTNTFRTTKRTFEKTGKPDAAIAATQKDRKSTRLNSSHIQKSRMPSSA